MIGGLYRGLTVAARPLIALYLRSRVKRDKEDPARLGERFGYPSCPRPSGHLVWFHGASVGEALSVLPLAERLTRERSRLSVLITTGTVSSARLLAERLPAGVFHQFVPVDTGAAVARFLDHWRPALALWVESELWPNLIAATQARGIPTVLIQGRMSAGSFRAWRRARGLIAPLLSEFALVLAQTPVDAERLGALGARAPKVTGTLKYALPPPPAQAANLAALDAAIGDRPVLLATSTHPGEEAAVLEADRGLRQSWPDLLTIIAPRHPIRGPDIAAMAREAGLTVARRGAGGLPKAGDALYVADTLGELGLFYRLSDVAFIGGSLVAHGGHNPIEAMQLKTPVLFGPHMTNFAEVVADLADAGALRQVSDGAELGDAVAALLAAPQARRALAEAQHALVAAKAGLLDDLLARLRPLLPSCAPSDHAST